MYDKKLKKGLYFVPLGGCGEIGRNFNMFGYVNESGHEEWILIDVGISIDKNYGITLQIPKYDFALNKNIIGAVLTHGHDDHIGALPIIIPRLEEHFKENNPKFKSIPIYATKFTMGLITRKFEEYNVTGDFRIVSRRIKLEFEKMQETNKFIRGMVSWVGFNQTLIELKYTSYT